MISCPSSSTNISQAKSRRRCAMSDHNCETCGAAFQRAEHLARHQLLHLGERPFSCSNCERRFSRRYASRTCTNPGLANCPLVFRDTLQRHLAVHRETLEQGSRSTGAKSRVRRACRICAHSKLRCDGQNPCKRCLAKGNTCSYPQSHPGVSRPCLEHYHLGKHA